METKAKKNQDKETALDRATKMYQDEHQEVITSEETEETLEYWKERYEALQKQWNDEIYERLMLFPVKHNERMFTDAVLIDYSEATRQYNPEATHLLHILTEIDNVDTSKKTNATINQYLHRIVMDGVSLSDIEVVNTMMYKTNRPYPFSGHAAALTLELKIKGYETQASKGVAYSKVVRLNENGDLSKINANNRYEIRNQLPGENLRVRVLSEKTDYRYTADELMKKLGIEGNVLEFTHDWDFEEAESYLYILKIKRNI